MVKGEGDESFGTKSSASRPQGQKQRGEGLGWSGGGMGGVGGWRRRSIEQKKERHSSQPCKQTMKPHQPGRELGTCSRGEQSGSSPTGPSWETVCMLKESPWPGFCSSSPPLGEGLGNHLALLDPFLGSSSLCPVNLRAERWGREHGGAAVSQICRRPENPFPPGRSAQWGLKGPEE